MTNRTHPADAGRHSFALITSAVLLALAGPARAQDAVAPAAPAASAPEATTLAPVHVKAKADQETATSPVPGYTAKRSATATKTDTPLIETGQSISVVTRERMDAIGATTLTQALGYTPGVKAGAYGEDSRYDWLTLRGFDAYSPGYFLDGTIARNNNAWSTWRLDNYGAERIEVLRGPASVLYGQNGPGGVVNVVSKRPTDEPLREFQAQIGTFSRRQVSADLSGPIDDEGKALFRFTGLVRDSGTQVDHVPDDRVFIAPAFTWRPSNDTTLTLLSHYQRDRSGTTLGFLPPQGTLTYNPNGSIPVSTFVGEPGFDRFDKDQWAVGYNLEHRLNDSLTLHQNARYGRIDLDYKQLIGAGFEKDADGTITDYRTLTRSSFGSREKVASLTLDNQAQARFATADWKHTVLLGLDYQRNRFDQVTFFGAAPSIDIFAPVYGQPVTPTDPYADGVTTLTQTGLYLQEQAKLGERWVLSVGGRYDTARNHLEDRLNASSADIDDHKFTKRAGVVYLAPAGWAPYLSYSESFSPVGIKGFKPESGRQYEAGVRYEPVGSRDSYSAAVFDLRRQNYVTTDSSFVPHQTGEVLVRGLELEATVSPMAGTNLTAAYTWTPTAKITESINPGDIGKQQTATSRHLLSLWADHRFRAGPADGLRIGLGVRYASSTLGDNNSSPAPLPAVTLVDAMLGYDIERWRLALNVRNLADKTYVANCGSTNCYYDSVRTVVGSVTYRY